MNAAAIQILERTPGTLRGLLGQATTEDLDWRPAPDRWSISMVLAHLADVEGNGFVARFRAMVGQEDPFLPSYDQLALFAAGRAWDGTAELTRLEAERLRTLEFLRTLPAEAGSRRGRHEQLGPITVAELLNEFAFHDLGHLRQLAELYRARVFYPSMGAFRNYYQIHP